MRSLPQPDTAQLAGALEQALRGAALPAGGVHAEPLGLRPLSDFGWLGAAPAKRAALLNVPGPDGHSRCFLGKGHPASLVAAGGTGKSHALIQLAVAVASGTPWLGFAHPEHAGNVLLMLGEEDEAETHRRLYHAAKTAAAENSETFNEDVLAANLYPMALRGQDCALVDENDADTPFATNLLREVCAPDRLWSLIILDPAARFMGQNTELDPHSGTRWVEVLERLCDAPGNPTVLFGQHTNKAQGLSGVASNQGAARGTSAITDAVRWQCNLEKVAEGKGRDARINERRVRLRVVKSNYTAIGDPVELERDDQGRLQPMDEKSVIDAENDARDAGNAEVCAQVLTVLRSALTPLSADALRSLTGQRRTRLVDALRILEASGQAHRTRSGWMPNANEGGG